MTNLGGVLADSRAGSGPAPLITVQLAQSEQLIGRGHHIPRHRRVQRDVHRFAATRRHLVAMQHARRSLHRQDSIRVVRRCGLAERYPPSRVPQDLGTGMPAGARGQTPNGSGSARHGEVHAAGADGARGNTGESDDCI